MGTLSLLAPLTLLALAALPVLWWLIRRFPPAPRRQLLPSLELLGGLRTEEEADRRTPPLLTAMRIAALALLILGFTGPVWSPQPSPAAPGAAAGAVLVVIDDGWTSAAAWPSVVAAASAVAAEAGRSGGATHLLTTARRAQAHDPSQALTAAQLRSVLDATEPVPWRPDRAGALERLRASNGLPARFARVVWFSDGLDDPGAAGLGAALGGLGPLELRRPPSPVRAIAGLSPVAEGLSVDIRRMAGAAGPGTVAVTATTLDGRSIGSAEGRFAPGTDSLTLVIRAPAEVIGQTALVRIVGETTAGAVVPADWSLRRPNVGIVSDGGGPQPLTQEMFFVQRALAPSARLAEGTLEALLERGVEVIVLGDTGALAETVRAALGRWVENGGLLLRFAGPRLAEADDDLLPVRLRVGARALDGAIAWTRPEPLAPLPETGPFAGLATSPEALVRRQVLADPTALGAAEVWARLRDGTPLVTAGVRGRGRLVLFHVTANPEWSDLPLTGLWPALLARTVALAGPVAEPTEPEGGQVGTWRAVRLLDGFGRLRAASPSDGANAVTIAAVRPADLTAGPDALPGVYERGGLVGALPAVRADEAFASLAAPAGAAEVGLAARRDFPFGGWLVAAGLLLLVLDAILAPFLSGRRAPIARLPGLGLGRRSAAGMVLAVIAAALAAIGPAPPAHAEDDPTLDMRLAFVRTGDARLDAMTRAGLEGLRQQLQRRTAVEPGPTVAVDPERDDLAAFPLLYWAAPDQPRPLSQTAARRLDRFLRTGGTLVIDTRDAERRLANPDARPAAIMLRGIDAPPLMPVPDDHVLGKAFYLLDSFPGRTGAGPVWVETPAAAAARDGVSSIIVGDADWAAAWALDARGMPMVAVDGGEREREMAIRFGINLVMVTLTGNYKSDQVHTPALLERLRQ
jgi:hypothetical protein